MGEKFCTNCAAEVAQKYCGNCGEVAELKRINGHYILHEIEHVLHFERGILYTIKELLINPGSCIRNFISESRSRLVKPIIFIIITSLIYMLINNFFHIEDIYIKQEGLPTDSSYFKMLTWMQANYGYMNIISAAFIALWLKIFFRKYNYNFFELIIMLCFILGITMLIFAVFGLITGLTDINLFAASGVLGFVYAIYGIGNFYKKGKVSSYLKAFGSYILGFITMFLAVFIIGFAVDSLFL
ncbi:DUF3667 domain-containing protein [Chryseobacterium sp. MP_3.2]|uniref:DUF3667 domain-containing protein n=1 Tax=Chryseobacterium sp. MP_3.2 TaxID=3071712 RepID=UPI002E0A1E0C|nr:hypothetical protein [Chryseobacterium sp. MP_3.2]